jgi:hypothetical protein
LIFFFFNHRFLHTVWARSHLYSHSYIFTDWQMEIQKPQFREEFECKLSAMPEAEIYFLLNTFAAMALARGPEDADFILAATLDLFQVIAP